MSSRAPHDPSSGDPSGARALVLGSGIAGMCAARVLARYFDHVVVVERDTLADGAQPRRGVPQSLQPHGLLPNGRAALEQLFPGFLPVLLGRGACRWDLTDESARFTPYGWAIRRRLGFEGLGSTRPLQEAVLRALLCAQTSNVRLLTATKVTGLLVEDGTPSRVLGIETDASDPRLRELRAELVVDAMGRGSRVLAWLEKKGIAAPEIRTVDARCSYATRHFRKPAVSERYWWKAMIIDNAPPDMGRGASLIPVEGDRWIVTAIGNEGDHAPTDEAGWDAWMASLRSSALSAVLREAEPLTDVVQNRSTINRWVQLHRWKEHPQGLLMFGDTAVTFNPSYGQGITSAAMQARTLDGVLSRNTGGKSTVIGPRALREFRRLQFEIGLEGWRYSTSLDLRWPGAKGKRRWAQGTEQGMTRLLEQAALHDGELMKVLIPLLDLGNSRDALLAPSFLLRLGYRLAKHRFAQPTLPGAETPVESLARA